MSVQARSRGGVEVYAANASNRLLKGQTFSVTFEFVTSGITDENIKNLIVKYRRASDNALIDLNYDDDYLVTVNDPIEQRLDIFGTIQLLRNIEDVLYLVIQRRVENSQDIDAFSNASIQDIINSLDKRTMVSQDQGQLSGSVRMPIDKVVVNNISGDIVADYAPNCLLGVKDDMSKIVPVYPDGKTIKFVDNEDGTRVVTAQTALPDFPDIDIVAQCMAVWKQQTFENDVLKNVTFALLPLVQGGFATTVSYKNYSSTPTGNTPSGNSNSNDTPTDDGTPPLPDDMDDPTINPDTDYDDSALKVISINSANVTSSDDNIIVDPETNDAGTIVNFRLRADIDKISEKITERIIITPEDRETIQREIREYITENIDNLVPQELVRYQAGNHISLEEATFAWRTTVVEAIRTVLPTVISAVPEVVLQGIGLSPELLNLLIQGQVSEFTADTIIQIGQHLMQDYIFSALPSFIQRMLPADLQDLVDDKKVYRINCIFEAGRNITFRGEKIDCALVGGDNVEVDDETHKINCTLTGGKDIAIDNNAHTVSSLLAPGDYMRYREIDHTLHSTLRPSSNVRFTNAAGNVGEGEITRIEAPSVGIAQSAEGILNVSTTTNNDNIVTSYLIGIENLEALRGEPGKDGQDGAPGKDGQDGVSPHIGQNGNWFIGETDTGTPARGATGATGETGATGAAGRDGATPEIINNYWYINGQNTGVKAVGQDGQDGNDGVMSPEEVQTIVNNYISTPENPVNVSVKNVVEEVSNDKGSNTLKPILYTEGNEITITGGVVMTGGGSKTDGDNFLTKIVNGVKEALPLITAVTSVVAPEVAAAISLIEELKPEEKSQATAGDISSWGPALVLKLIPALTKYLPSWLQALIPENKKQLGTNVNGETYVYTVNGRSYTFICPDGSIDITRTDNGKISSQISLKVSDDLKESLRGKDGQNGRDGKDYFSVRDLPQIVANLSATGGAGVFPIAENTIVGAGGSVTTTGVGEPVNNSPMVPVPSEVIVKSMPTYDVDRDVDVIGIKKYTGSATLQEITPTYLAVTRACELLLGISEENSVRLQWDKISIIPPTYNGETQPQVGAFSYSEATGNLLIVCSNVNYVFGVHIGSTFETLTYTIFDTTTYCPSPYGANGGECCAWSGSSSAFFVAPSNNEVTGSLLIISADQNGVFSIGTDSDFDRSQVPGSFDYVKCDLLRSSTVYDNCSDVLICMTSNGYVYRKRYVNPLTFVHNFYVPTLASLSDVSTLEVLGRVPVFSPEVESEIWQQIILFRYKTTSSDAWIYKQTILYGKTSNYTRDLDNCFANNQKPSRLVGECVRAREGTYGEGRVYTQDGKCWWYRPYITPANPSSGQAYISVFWSNGAYDTTNITGANSICDVIDKEYAVDNTRYWAFNATSNNWVKYAFFTDRYQYQIVRSLYTFDGYLSALANVTVDNTLLQFFMWTQDGGDTWSFTTLNDGTDDEYIDCIYGLAGVLFIPKRWETYAVLQSLNGNIEKKTVEATYEYTAGGFVIKSDGVEKYCVFCCDEENFKDAWAVMVTTSTPGTPSSWNDVDEHFNVSDGLDGINDPTEALNNHSHFAVGMIRSGENGQNISNVMAGVMPSLGNGFVFWDESLAWVSPVVLNGMEPIGAPVFDENGLALLVKKSNNQSTNYSVIYYSLPNAEGDFNRDDFLGNLQEFSIYAPSSFVPAYKPEQLMYNRLTGLWTLFYRRQPNYQNDKGSLIAYTASTLAELATGTRSALWETEDIKLDTLVYNQYGFCSFGAGKVMLSSAPKNIFDLLSFLNYNTKKQEDEISGLRQMIAEYDELFATKAQLANYVPANEIASTYATINALSVERSKRILYYTTSGSLVDTYVLSFRRILWTLKYLTDALDGITGNSTVSQNNTLAKAMIWNDSAHSSAYNDIAKPKNNHDDN